MLNIFKKRVIELIDRKTDLENELKNINEELIEISQKIADTVKCEHKPICSDLCSELCTGCNSKDIHKKRVK